MRVVNKSLIKRFMMQGLCECCGRPRPEGRDPHHIFSKGAGRVDIRGNLISLCRECHNGFHGAGNPSRDYLLALAAKRERTTPDAIESMVYRFRADKRCKVWNVDKEPP